MTDQRQNAHDDLYDEIDRLKAENERLCAALKLLVEQNERLRALAHSVRKDSKDD